MNKPISNPMDEKFQPAERAIVAGNLAQLDALIHAEPGLATGRSGCSHPTLLQCLVLTMPPADGLEHSIGVLAEHAAELTDPLIAAASIGNARAIVALLRLGAAIDGNGRWSPLDEALYWGNRETAALLVASGARVDSLRKAAGLGHMDYIDRCFDVTGALTPAAGCVAWPWFDQPVAAAVKFDRQQVIDNGLIYAAAWGQVAAAEMLLARGAQINALPAGFDFTGTPLHYAALNNCWEMADYLLSRGADPLARDAKVNSLPDGWAEQGGHQQLAEHLSAIAKQTARERGLVPQED